MGGQCPSPAAIPPGKETQYPLYHGSLGGPRDRPAWVREISPQLGFEPRILQRVPSCYTEYSTPATDIQPS